MKLRPLLFVLGLGAAVTACSTVERGTPQTQAAGAANDLPTLWAARLKSVVAVEFVTESEIDRRPSISMGTVIDAQGTIILPPEAVDTRAATWQLKEFKIYLPGEAAGTPGEYLGQDAFTGWHFVRATDAETRASLEPITKYVSPQLRPIALADFVWGIGLRDKDEDFAPYIMQSNVALIQSLPQQTAIAQREVAAPGLPVFDREGHFVGIAQSSFGQSYLQFSRESRGSAVVLINVEESSAFATAEEVVPYLGRVPKNVSGRPIAWLGAYGLGPMDRDVAKFFHLENQSGAVVSQVLEGSPAEKAGLKDRDIILALDGKPLPQFKPDRVVVSYIEREVDRRSPGDILTIGVLRGSERLELKATLAEQPKLAREAERKYFDRLGFTVREFVYGDAIDRRVSTADATGVIVHFVKPSSAAAVAGMFFDDWIKEIDGVEVKTFTEAVDRLTAIERDALRPECVILVVRGGETAVLRLKLR